MTHVSQSSFFVSAVDVVAVLQVPRMLFHHTVLTQNFWTRFVTILSAASSTSIAGKARTTAMSGSLEGASTSCGLWVSLSGAVVSAYSKSMGWAICCSTRCSVGFSLAPRDSSSAFLASGVNAPERFVAVATRRLPISMVRPSRRSEFRKLLAILTPGARSAGAAEPWTSTTSHDSAPSASLR